VEESNPRGRCAACHIPYSVTQPPFRMQLSKCAVCRWVRWQCMCVWLCVYVCDVLHFITDLGRGWFPWCCYQQLSSQKGWLLGANRVWYKQGISPIYLPLLWLCTLACYRVCHSKKRFSGEQNAINVSKVTIELLKKYCVYFVCVGPTIFGVCLTS